MPPRLLNVLKLHDIADPRVPVRRLTRPKSVDGLVRELHIGVVRAIAGIGAAVGLQMHAVAEDGRTTTLGPITFLAPGDAPAVAEMLLAQADVIAHDAERVRTLTGRVRAVLAGIPRPAPLTAEDAAEQPSADPPLVDDHHDARVPRATQAHRPSLRVAHLAVRAAGGRR